MTDGLRASDSQESLDSRERIKRKREILAAVVLIFVFAALTFTEFRLTKVSSALPLVNSIFFFGLLNINVVLLIAIIWLLFRNIGKLFIERRKNVLGSRLKTKLVMAFVGLSVVPTLLLFTISALYINSSFDKWFSIKVQNTLQASLEITHVYYRNAEETAKHFAEHLSQGLGSRFRLQSSPAASSEVLGFLSQQRELLALDAVEFYSDPLDERVMARQSGKEGLPDFFPRLPLDVLDQAFSGERVSLIQHVGAGDLIRCLVPVRAGGASGPGGQAIHGVLAVSAYIPVSLVNKVDEIASVFNDYKDTNPLKYPIKTAYFVLLIMITLVIIVVAVWIGFFMAKELTVPVERLVSGARAVGAGNLDVSVSATGNDEIAVLVDTFNKMTRDLRENRERLNQATVDLEQRRLQLEAVLTNVGTGVIAVDRHGAITTFNRAASQLLEMEPSAVVGNGFRETFANDLADLADVIDRSLGDAGAGTHGELPETVQWNFRKGESVRALVAVATRIRDRDTDWGSVVVIEDLSHLIKGQREMAWREVARRIAHEIKNPLTPIKLSAQRLQRKLGGFSGREASLLQECTDTIIKHTDELKEMVNEFSNFARFPEISPAPHDLNAALKEVVVLFEQAHVDMKFVFEAEPRMPIFEFDRDQIKRVVINLLDNAVAAFQPTGDGKRPDRGSATPAVKVESHFNEELQMAVIQIRDNGPGMSEEIKTRIFEPYFSTKSEGTGLGLAIAKRIVNDHDGFIRVHSTLQVGTEFVIELPTALWHGLERRAR